MLRADCSDQNRVRAEWQKTRESEAPTFGASFRCGRKALEPTLVNLAMTMTNFFEK